MRVLFSLLATKTRFGTSPCPSLPGAGKMLAFRKTTLRRGPGFDILDGPEGMILRYCALGRDIAECFVLMMVISSHIVSPSVFESLVSVGKQIDRVLRRKRSLRKAG
jgi:hypothetical protein